MAENFQRKDFMPSEAVAIRRALEPAEKEAAERRMKSGKPSGGCQGRFPQQGCGVHRHGGAHPGQG